MQVYVLLDREARVYGAITDAEAAEEWLTFDDSFGFAECKLDDYTSFNMVVDAVAESNFSFPAGPDDQPM
jgi:hypothetical protein